MIGVAHVLKGHKPDHFIEQFRLRGVVLHPVTERSRHMTVCPFCGYLLAGFYATPDFLVETCSAFLLEDMVSNPKFAKYVGTLTNSKNKHVSSLSSSASEAMVVPAGQGND